MLYAPGTVDRFGLFVDAGYLLMAAGKLCVGASRRPQVACDYKGIHQALVAFAEANCSLPVLRTYWYDGAPGPHREPTTDHLTISRFPFVKLRLGRIIANQQKGVDSMIYRDMTTLAREKAISVAYLLSGDEDLREGVVQTQESGVQVFLLGVPGSNQSFSLINESDGHLIPPKEFWTPHFAGPAAREVPAPRALEMTRGKVGETEEDTIRSVGFSFCESWLKEADGQLPRLVLDGAPVLPKDIDGPLLRSAETVVGSLRSREDLRRSARNAFLERLAERLADEDRPRDSDS